MITALALRGWTRLARWLQPRVLRVPEPTQQDVDDLQRMMLGTEQLECPVVHRFTPGLYVRECTMPKGALVISKIHKTEHPFVISRGDISVWIEGVGVQRFVAPFTGITKPGTRRVLVAHEETVWTTFHPTGETDVARIEAAIIEPRALTGGPTPCLG